MVQVTLQWKWHARRAVISQVLLVSRVTAGHKPLTWETLSPKTTELCFSATVQEVSGFKSRLTPPCSLFCLWCAKPYAFLSASLGVTVEERAGKRMTMSLLFWILLFQQLVGMHGYPSVSCGCSLLIFSPLLLSETVNTVSREQN